MQMVGGKAPQEPLRVWVEEWEVRWVLILARSHMVETLSRLGRMVWSWIRWQTRLGLSLMTSSIYLGNLSGLFGLFFCHFFTLQCVPVIIYCLSLFFRTSFTSSFRFFIRFFLSF